MKTPLSLAALLIVGACASPGPDYTSHWSAGSAAPSAEKVFTGYDAELSGSRMEYGRQNSADIALTVRRHFFNDNPSNPLQQRRGWGNLDSPYNMTAGLVDAKDLTVDGLVGTYHTAVATGLSAVDLVFGVPLALVGVNYQGASTMWDGGDGVPSTPEEFTTHSF